MRAGGAQTGCKTFLQAEWQGRLSTLATGMRRRRWAGVSGGWARMASSSSGSGWACPGVVGGLRSDVAQAAEPIRVGFQNRFVREFRAEGLETVGLALIAEDGLPGVGLGAWWRAEVKRPGSRRATRRMACWAILSMAKSSWASTGWQTETNLSRSFAIVTMCSGR
jgi:hypothetical protein